MSNYVDAAYHPKERVIRKALWMDDYFGRHRYGVCFPGDETVYPPDEVRIPTDATFIPEQEIIALRAENARLRAALYEADEGCRFIGLYDERAEADRAALSGKDTPDE